MPVIDVKLTVGKNLTALRQAHKMTQSELAEKLNYSDKAISKWERGESIPDVSVLKSIADLFGVTVDYLLQEDHEEHVAPIPESSAYKHRNRKIIMSLGVLIVWFVATFTFVVLDTAIPKTIANWLPFLYAVPITMIVWLVFNSIWFNKRRNYLIISLLMWTALATFVLTVAAWGVWVWKFFFLGIPGQIAIYAWSRLHTKSNS